MLVKKMNAMNVRSRAQVNSSRHSRQFTSEIYGTVSDANDHDVLVLKIVPDLRIFVLKHNVAH
jgi:hypothetical protein